MKAFNNRQLSVMIPTTIFSLWTNIPTATAKNLDDSGRTSETIQVITVVEDSENKLLLSSLPETVTAWLGYEASVTKNPFCYDYDFGGSVYNPIPSPFPRSTLKYYEKKLEAVDVSPNSVTFHVPVNVGICRYQAQFMYLRLDRNSEFYVRSSGLQISFSDREPSESYASFCELKNKTSYSCEGVELSRDSENVTIFTEW